MKLKLFLTIALLVGIVSGASAVTDGEMEQARAITAKNYLRWVNNGSGYLDDLKELPKSMSDLKKSLKPKELENLKKFESVAVAKDYASWDKAKLVAYWSETFLSNPALDAVGKGSRSRTVKHLNSMNISAPSKEPSKPEVTKTEEPAKPAAEEAVNSAESPAPDPTADEIAGEMVAAEPGPAETIEKTEEAIEDAEAARPKKSNSTWIYVGILVFLVIVVVILVVYAARAMKNNDGENADDSDEIGSGSSERKSVRDEVQTYEPGENVSRKEHEFMIERKNEKIRKVKAELDVVREENARLQAAHDALQQRLSQAQTQIESLRIALGEAEKKTETSRSAANMGSAASPRTQIRSLYLGRVNKNGLFVRADRQLNPEATVYRLDTEDGYTGSFRVVNTPEVVDRVIENPAQWLESGCTGKNLLEPGDATEIITESSGTAVLEDGCWKIIRKAGIRYV